MVINQAYSLASLSQENSRDFGKPKIWFLFLKCKIILNIVWDVTLGQQKYIWEKTTKTNIHIFNADTG